LSSAQKSSRSPDELPQVGQIMPAAGTRWVPMPVQEYAIDPRPQPADRVVLVAEQDGHHRREYGHFECRLVRLLSLQGFTAGVNQGRPMTALAVRSSINGRYAITVPRQPRNSRRLSSEVRPRWRCRASFSFLSGHGAMVIEQRIGQISWRKPSTFSATPCQMHLNRI
jgi:hypothetical protein